MKTPVRVVHDTSVLISALVLSASDWSWLRQLWKSGHVIPLTSPQTIDELERVLSYRKFALEPAEQREVLAAYSLRCEIVVVSNAPEVPSVRDVDDRPFLELAFAGEADALVASDHHLLELAPKFSVPILTPRQFREWLRERPTSVQP